MVSVSFSVLAVLAVAVGMLVRFAGLRVFHAAVCVLLGFSSHLPVPVAPSRRPAP
jgi:hypothetical protein